MEISGHAGSVLSGNQHLEVAGEDEDSIAKWVCHRFGNKTPVKTEAAAFIWLDAPLLPAEYPETAADLYRLAEWIDREARTTLEQAAEGEPDAVLVLLGALGRGGAASIGVKAFNPKRRKGRPRAPDEPLSIGFRPGHTPEPLLLSRFFGAAPVVRTLVQHADADWVHGRGQDARTRRLLGARVVVIGCGSVGAPVACVLAQAGVGHLILVDPELLTWPNVGRHPVGATAVGRNKAEALAERLQADFPHLKVEHRACGLHQLIVRDEDLLAAADMIVAATGNWVAESALNRWHVRQGRPRPIIYGRTGAPELTAVEWPDGGGISQEEPACGAHYQPYGPVELAYVNAMIAEVALDCLLDPPAQSFSRVFVASPRRIASLGGHLTESWRSAFGEVEEGVRTVDRSWHSSDCEACRRGYQDEVN